MPRGESDGSSDEKEHPPHLYDRLSRCPNRREPRPKFHSVDENAGTTWNRDRDDDRYGNEDRTYGACHEPLYGNWAKKGGDCNDKDPSVHEDC